MKLTITVKQLESLSACSEGVALFKKIYGDKAIIKWTLEAQLELIKSPMGRYLGWAFWSKLLPLWSMRYANLSGADLRSTNLSCADLSSANLRSADLSYADLSYANLSGANLRSANLSCADLRSANLSCADLRSANLSSANLRSANLRSALSLEGAYLDADPKISGYKFNNGRLWRC